MTIRDPRDIVVSMLNVGAKQEKLNINNQFPRNMKTLCDRINTSYRLYFDENQKKFLEFLKILYITHLLPKLKKYLLKGKLETQFL